MSIKEMTENETKVESKEWAIKRLLMFIEICPHVIKSGIGIEKFVDELNDAVTKFREFPLETIGSIGTIEKLIPLIKACPNIFKPEIGLIEFVKDLGNAASKFKLYFPEKDIKKE